MKKTIDHYAILAKKRYTEGYYFIDGYKTLPTMKKHYNNAITNTRNKPHDKMILVARDYDRNIIKVYESEE